MSAAGMFNARSISVSRNGSLPSSARRFRTRESSRKTASPSTSCNSTTSWTVLLTTTVHIPPEEGKLFEDGKTTVNEALLWLSMRYKFAIEVNEKAFEIAGGKAEDRLNEPLLGKGPFPIFMDVSLATVLQKILSR